MVETCNAQRVTEIAEDLYDFSGVDLIIGGVFGRGCSRLVVVVAAGLGAEPELLLQVKRDPK